ncbi:GNAT family N-acetyltransferase [Halobellus captivus]|uniref:GNAT family N-acetyltransferase n=1 Tax=Halobellus captivus TaxID=2592614 RepID=UPI001396A864|nr:GNAT family N-acetyltransferase [Halobellus captivus]
MSTVSHRRARAADVPRLIEIHRRAVRDLGSAYYTDRQIEAWAAEAREDAYPVVGSDVLLVAECDDDILGFGQLSLERPEISKLFVDPVSAGDGIGTSLLAELERFAAERGISELFLDASLNAANFYHRNGYTYGEMLNKYLPVDGGEVVFPALRMEKKRIDRD